MSHLGRGKQGNRYSTGLSVYLLNQLWVVLMKLSRHPRASTQRTEWSLMSEHMLSQATLISLRLSAPNAQRENPVLSISSILCADSPSISSKWVPRAMEGDGIMRSTQTESTSVLEDGGHIKGFVDSSSRDTSS